MWYCAFFFIRNVWYESCWYFFLLFLFVCFWLRCFGQYSTVFFRCSGRVVWKDCPFKDKLLQISKVRAKTTYPKIHEDMKIFWKNTNNIQTTFRQHLDKRGDFYLTYKLINKTYSAFVQELQISGRLNLTALTNKSYLTKTLYAGRNFSTLVLPFTCASISNICWTTTNSIHNLKLRTSFYRTHWKKPRMLCFLRAFCLTKTAIVVSVYRPILIFVCNNWRTFYTLLVLIIQLIERYPYDIRFTESIRTGHVSYLYYFVWSFHELVSYAL